MTEHGIGKSVEYGPHEVTSYAAVPNQFSVIKPIARLSIEVTGNHGRLQYFLDTLDDFLSELLRGEYKDLVVQQRARSFSKVY